MHPFNQALLQREVELLSSLRDIDEEKATPAGFPAKSMMDQSAIRWSTPPHPSRWRVIDTPRGEALVKAAAR